MCPRFAASAATFELSCRSALLGPPLCRILSEEAPHIDVEFRPSRRLDNVRLLADGSLDLVVGVLYPERSEIERSVLHNEHFVIDGRELPAIKPLTIATMQTR